MAQAPAALRSMDLAQVLSSSLAPVQAQILVNLGPKEFLALSEVSKPVNFALKEGLRATVYNIDIKLKKFFSDPKAFRKVQVECDAIIVDAAGDGFVRKLLETEPSAVHAQLITASSTAMLPFITWNEVYWLFPRATILNRIGYLLCDTRTNPFDDYRRKHLNELSNDGIKTLGANWNTDEEDAPQKHVRRIGDKMTCVFKFDVSELHIDHCEPTYRAVIERITFQLHLEKRTSNVLFSCYVMMCKFSIDHAILKHSYFTAPGDSVYAQKIQELIEKLDDTTRLNLSSLPPDKRPEDYDRLTTIGA